MRVAKDEVRLRLHDTGELACLRILVLDRDAAQRNPPATYLDLPKKKGSLAR